MSGAALILLSVALVVGDSGASELIAKLGASRYAEREGAAAELERLGRAALPALRASRQHPDLEVRTRVNTLLARIEGSLLLEPTPVTLDFQDRPVAEVVRAINDRSGARLALAPEAPAVGASKRVTLRADQPVPFWTAVDRLCDASGLNYSFPGLVNSNVRMSGLTISAGGHRPGGPMSDHGPFRVNLMSLHYQRDFSFGVNPGMPMQVRQVPIAADGTQVGQAASEQFYLRLQVAAEPQLSLRQAGPLRLATAVDELGHSLVPPEPPPGMAQVSGYYGGPAPGPIQLQVYLKRPENAGRTIRQVKGVLPLTVSSRKAEPLVIGLEGATGKTYRNDEATVAILEAKPNPNSNQQMIELIVTPEASRVQNPDVAPEPEFFVHRPDVGPMQIELANAAGDPVAWYISSSTQNGEETRLTLTTMNGPAGVGGVPTTLRFYGTNRMTTEVPFEFRNVPMP
jgi:hypothetical protein